MSMAVEVTIKYALNIEPRKYRGKVLETTNMPEEFDGQWQQVPAMLIERQDNHEIVLQPLMKEHYEIKVRRI